MDLTRRNILAGLATLTATAGITGGSASLKAQQSLGSTAFARGALMPGLAPGYLNNASHHPVTSGAAAAIAGYANNLVTGQAEGVSQAVRSKFARLINANADEIVYAPSTSMGENLVNGLGSSAKGRPDRYRRTAFCRLILLVRTTCQARHGGCRPSRA